MAARAGVPEVGIPVIFLSWSSPAQRLSKVPPCGRWDLIPAGGEHPGALLHFRVHRVRPALPALEPFAFPVARHAFAARGAERGPGQDVPRRNDEAHLLQVDAPLLVTPDRDDLIA